MFWAMDLTGGPKELTVAILYGGQNERERESNSAWGSCQYHKYCTVNGQYVYHHLPKYTHFKYGYKFSIIDIKHKLTHKQNSMIYVGLYSRWYLMALWPYPRVSLAMLHLLNLLFTCQTKRTKQHSQITELDRLSQRTRAWDQNVSKSDQEYPL